MEHGVLAPGDETEHVSDMCTLVILRRSGHSWPLILAANRDEMIDRPWKAPGRHWPDRPEIIAGMDDLAGGSWLGINEHGVVACILNRHGTLGPGFGKRSRGELVLEALDHADAIDAARAIADVEPSSYRPFNMFVADNRDAIWLAHRDESGPVTPMRVPEGVSMLTAYDLNDIEHSDRVRRYLPRFRAAPAPRPDADEWSAWSMLMGASDHAGNTPVNAAMNFRLESGFGTSSSALIALPLPGQTAESDRKSPAKPIFLFAAGRPDVEPYYPVEGLGPTDDPAA